MGLDYSTFEEIVHSIMQEYCYITDYEINNGMVTAMVKSRSGKSKWQFKLYFNVNDIIDGEWEYWCGMPNTPIPQVIGRRISSEIKKLVN